MTEKEIIQALKDLSKLYLKDELFLAARQGLTEAKAYRLLLLANELNHTKE